MHDPIFSHAKALRWQRKKCYVYGNVQPGLLLSMGLRARRKLPSLAKEGLGVVVWDPFLISQGKPEAADCINHPALTFFWDS